MKTPQEKYENDPQYHQLVDMFRYFIEKCEFTPSEIREASILACIHYETNRKKYRNIANPEQTWDGIGKRPAWLDHHLASTELSLDDFLISAPYETL